MRHDVRQVLELTPIRVQLLGRLVDEERLRNARTTLAIGLALATVRVRGINAQGLVHGAMSRRASKRHRAANPRNRHAQQIAPREPLCNENSASGSRYDPLTVADILLPAAALVGWLHLPGPTIRGCGRQASISRQGLQIPVHRGLLLSGKN